MRHFFVALTAATLLTGCFCPPEICEPTSGRSVVVKFNVTHHSLQLESRAHEAGDPPGTSALLYLWNNTSQASPQPAAEVRFYPEGDGRITAPRYDAGHNRVYITYAISRLGEIQRILADAKTVQVFYYQPSVGMKHNAEVRGRSF